MTEAPVGFNWTGGYVGVQAGYTRTSSTLDSFSETHLAASPDVDSLSVGGMAGFRYQFANNIVAGVEADVNWLSGSGSDQWINMYALPGNEIYPDSPKLDLNWDASIRLTLGYAVDRWLPYITGGVAFLDYDVDVYPIRFPGQVETGGTETGWTLGGGLAYAFTDKLIGHVDYRYADFGTTETRIADDFHHEDTLETHKVNFGLAYKF